MMLWFDSKDREKDQMRHDSIIIIGSLDYRWSQIHSEKQAISKQ